MDKEIKGNWSQRVLISWLPNQYIEESRHFLVRRSDLEVFWSLRSLSTKTILRLYDLIILPYVPLWFYGCTPELFTQRCFPLCWLILEVQRSYILSESLRWNNIPILLSIARLTYDALRSSESAPWYLLHIVSLCVYNVMLSKVRDYIFHNLFLHVTMLRPRICPGYPLWIVPNFNSSIKIKSNQVYFHKPACRQLMLFIVKQLSTEENPSLYLYTYLLTISFLLATSN